MYEYDFYDIVLDLQSLSNLKEGFQINYTEKGRQKLVEFKNKYFTGITAIGNSNQGKSFILSKISEINIPLGHNINTHGLSIYFPDNYYSNKNYIILDTVGLQKVITIDDEKRKDIKKLKDIEKILIDKLKIQNFLQAFAMESSHIVIAVVGQLTFQDQKFLNRIKEICKNKDLFIIHNLMFLKSKEEVENYIKDTIEASLFFKLEKQSMINFRKKKKIKIKIKKKRKKRKKKMKKWIIYLLRRWMMKKNIILFI